MTVNGPIGDGRETIDRHYFTLSRKLTAELFAKAVRDHWSIGNRLYRQLNVTFGEDPCRVRQGRADMNVRLIGRPVLTPRKNERTAAVGGQSETTFRPRQ